ncbi:hypothetical protein FOA52_015806 [Chlamydomonas sp. UWO 241]|nr:hypothetical protein FOA52_015806 [Chlamydomonas sp. UWO 241]
MIDIDALIRPLMITDLRVQCRARGLNPAGAQQTLRERLADHMIATNNFNVNMVAGDGGGAARAEQAGAALSPNNYVRPGGAQNVGNKLTEKPSSRVLAPPGGKSTISFGDYSAPPAAGRDYAEYRDPAANAPPHGGGGGGAAAYFSGGMGGAPNPMSQGQVRNMEGPYQAPNAPYAQPPFEQQQHREHTPSQAPYAQQGQQQYERQPYEQQQQQAQQHMQQMQAPYAQQQQQPQQHQQQMNPNGSPSGQTIGSSNNNYSRPGGVQNVGNFITDRPSSRVLAPPGGKSQISFG